jgi:hypothetical protein
MCGKRYLLTVDLENNTPAEEWPYETEEYELSCMLDTAGLFSWEAAGEDSIVVHRFGYGSGITNPVIQCTPMRSRSGLERWPM